MVTCRSSSIYTRKMNLIPILNKTSPLAHMESELDVLGVPWKLVKYIVYSSKRKNWKRIIFLHTSYKLQLISFFLSQWILGVKQGKWQIIWANAWLGVSFLAPANLLESISFNAYKFESFSFFWYKFFVIYEEQLNQKNYNVTFWNLITIIIKIDQKLIKVSINIYN